jgi:predicted Rossmann-fold nucleotide-binding protein
VVLPGGNGTLAELALAWEHVRKGLLPGAPRPIVAWEDPWRRVVELLAEGPYLGTGTDAITWVRSVDEAVAEIRRRLG